MRLTEQQQHIIKDKVNKIFGDSAQVLLLVQEQMTMSEVGISIY